jgi:hypothetical protein
MPGTLVVFHPKLQEAEAPTDERGNGNAAKLLAACVCLQQAVHAVFPALAQIAAQGLCDEYVSDDYEVMWVVQCPCRLQMPPFVDAAMACA